MSLSESIQNQPDFSAIKLGIVTPMANEKNSAERFVEEVLLQCRPFNLQSITYYIIFDNICTDGTMHLLQDVFKKRPEIKIIFSPENRNVVDAYMRGYREALSEGNDWILEIDAGYSHQPSDIRLFLETMQQGYDCVFGSRFLKGGVYRYNNLYRYIVSKWGTILVNLLVGTRLKDMTSGFEMFSSHALSSILDRGICSKGPFFQTEIKAYAHRYAFVEIPIHYKDGSHSIGGSTLLDSFSCLWRLLSKRITNTL